jgi:4-amino-4-deoxy-L-arabinose transferase-like glycosyltransferase
MMASLLVVLPLGVFLVLWAAHLGRGVQAGHPDGRRAFLEASVLWGALLTAGSEGLSLFHALERGWLAAYWGLVAAGAILHAMRSGVLPLAAAQLSVRRLRLSLLDWVLCSGIGCAVAGLLVVAWVSPPNNADSLLYHMSRVVHWAQNGGLQHYASSYVNQIVMPIWAETAILNLRVLWGNDHPANLVQWFALVGSLVAVSRIARGLGATRTGQAVSAAFVLATPMAVLQATSTQNDMVVAYWLVCLLFWVMEGRMRPWRSPETLYVGLTLGLGTLTKGTFYVFALPVMLWYLAGQLRSFGSAKMLSAGLLVAVLASMMNLGFWLRNFHTYGGILGSADHLASYLSVYPAGRTAGEGDTYPSATSTAVEGAVGMARAEVQMLGWNLRTPFLGPNQIIRDGFSRTPGLFGPEYADEYSQGLWNHEDTAGNLIPLVVVVLCLAPLAVWATGGKHGLAVSYSVASLAGFALLPLVISNGASLVGVRFQLPFFVSWAPLVGLLASSAFGGSWVPLIGVSFVLAGLPWLLLNNTRPLLGRMPWTTRTPSVLEASPYNLLFAMNPGVMDEYLTVADDVNRLGCQDVGLRIDSHDFEYLFWWILDAPQSGRRIESVYTYAELQPYVDPAFRPCAIICTICQGRSRLHGLGLVDDFGTVQLFAGTDYSPNPDG